MLQVSEVLGTYTVRYLQYLRCWEPLGTAILLLICPVSCCCQSASRTRPSTTLRYCCLLYVASTFVVFFRAGRLSGKVQVCVAVAVCLWEVPCSQADWGWEPWGIAVGTGRLSNASWAWIRRLWLKRQRGDGLWLEGTCKCWSFSLNCWGPSIAAGISASQHL